MLQLYVVVLAALVQGSVSSTKPHVRPSIVPDTVIVRSETASLRGLLWLPSGSGPFPAILLNHGSGRSPEELRRLGPYEGLADSLGPVFVQHGYVMLYLFRRGVGLSANQGISSIDLMSSELAANGQEGRNRIQVALLETREMKDALAGLAFLRARPEVDSHNVAVIGHSFGGSLSVLMSERDPKLRAAIIFSIGPSWDRSAQLRERLLAALGQTTVPLFFIHASNDYSLASGKALDANSERLGKPHLLKIYPPVGQSQENGHDFLYLGVSNWEPDVFSFLDAHMGD